MGKVYISVSKEEFKRQLVRADANGMREQLLMDAIKANAVIMSESNKNLVENLKECDGKDANRAAKLLELLTADGDNTGRKFEKRAVSALYGE